MTGSGNWVAQLLAFARQRAPERCELCGLALPPRHEHLLEPQLQRLVCSCTACALLFEHQAARRYRRVPRDGRLLPPGTLADADWEALGVPISIAFFCASSVDGRVRGFYPGAAGPVEAELDPATWARIAAASPALAALQPDVEALLVNRLHGARECWRLPIDRCYALAGLIRQHWRGFSGGDAVWQALDAEFAQLRREFVREAAHA